MDNLVAVALQEIASEGIRGCALQKLWKQLHSSCVALDWQLNVRVKQILWKRLIDVPGLQYMKANMVLPVLDPSLENVEDAEKAGVMLLASEDLRDSCLGIYDLKYADCRLSDLQRAILERLARARSKGVPQNQLGKEFGVEGNKLFYVLRGLEIRGLLVRQSIILRNDEATNNQSKGTPIVATNLVHLSRYAKHLTLGAHQRFEIRNASDSFLCETSSPAGKGLLDTDDDFTFKENKIQINDDLPAIKAICDKLEEAEGKVLVVSDIKASLGYRLAVGHRTWRRLMKRMQGAGLVETFNAEIEHKVVSCIRLCKSFDVQAFDQIDKDLENDQLLKGGKRGQITELVTELPIDQQIFDIIQKEDAAGLPMMEIWRRLGLNNKRNYYRVHNMITKHGIVFEAENHKRCMMYRLRAAGHVSRAGDSKAASSRAQRHDPLIPHEIEDDGNSMDNGRGAEAQLSKRRKTRQSGTLSTVEHAPEAIIKQDPTMQVLESVSQLEDKMDIDTAENSKNFNTGPHSDEVNDMTEVKHLSSLPPAIPLSLQSCPLLYRVGQPYPCLTVTTTSVQREMRILERLEREKFIVRAELHRWLEDQENRSTMMDRKTLTRVLQKLQRENQCKCVLLNMPGSSNCGRNRTTEVVLHPSIVVQPDLLCKIHESLRRFEIQSRANCISRGKKSNGTFPVLTGVKRMSPSKPFKKTPPPSGPSMEKAGSLQANGFVPAKMVRVRLLHLFLWDYVSGLPDADTNIGNTEVSTGSYKVFALGSAIQAIPLESFLQIVGSTKKFENLADQCKRGVRLCELPAEDHADLMDSNARGRLSWLVDVLRRLKLVRLVVGSGPILQPRKQSAKTFLSTIEAALTYAMEINPVVEEPASDFFPALNSEFLDVTPRARHEFNFCNKADVETYWQTLEYFFSGAEPSVARQAFPGSNVPELFGLRSWTSLRVMSVDQRNELLKRIGAGGVERRISAQECAQIAKDLNLTLEQVLKVSYEKNKSCRLQTLQISSSKASDLLFKGISNIGPVTTRDSCGNAKEIVSLMGTDNHLHSSQAELELIGTQFDTNLLSTERNNESKDDVESEEETQEENRTNHISAVNGLKPFRKTRFPWSDKLDRMLILSYAKQRALLGARYNHVDWATMRDLPASAVICRRRMTQLKADSNIRFSIMNLCQLFSVRYERSQEQIDSLGNATAVTCVTDKSLRAQLSSLLQDTEVSEGKHQTGSLRGQFIWDDVEDLSIVAAVEEVMKYKALARSRCSSRIIGYTGAGFENLLCSRGSESSRKQSGPQNLPSSISGMDTVSDGDLSVPGIAAPNHLKSSGSVKKILANYPSFKRIKRKPSLNDRLGLENLVRHSVSVANIVEFIKLIYLNLPANEENARLPKPFADGLRLFKENDVFAAFNLLRMRNLVAFEQSTKAFTLSSKFYINASKSRFPEGTFESCGRTLSWLKQNSTELQQDWIPFPLEIGYGQLLHLFRLATEGELLLSPLLPKDGIGENYEPTNISCKLKKKLETERDFAADIARLKTWDVGDSCETSRRERGFPGIQVNLHLASMSIFHLLGNTSESNHLASMPVVHLLGNTLETNMNAEGEDQCENSIIRTPEAFSPSFYDSCLPLTPHTESYQSESGQNTSLDRNELDLASCFDHWSVLPKSGDEKCMNCDLLRAAYHIVDLSGDDGIRIDQLAESLYNDGGIEFVTDKQIYKYVEALQSLDLVVQVNAYDHVRIVSKSHSQRYFFNIDSSTISLEARAHKRIQDDGSAALSRLEILNNTSDNLKRSIMSLGSNHHHEALFSAKIQSNQLSEDAVEDESYFVPILPWLTMDGSLNSPFFKALLHRIMGIVVLNPGIMEDDLVKQLDVLNPQMSRQLLHVLELDGYLHVRTAQICKAEAPFLLKSLIKQNAAETKTLVARIYYPCSSFTSMLE